MALDKITTAMITDDAVTAAKIPAGAIGSSEIAEGALSSSALQNTTSHTLSGTYAESRMYTSDAYVLGGDTTVNSNLVLSSVKGDDSDITLTDDGTTRTITGTGKLEGGSLVAKANTDASQLSGALGSTVTGSPALNLGNFTGQLSNDVTGAGALNIWPDYLPFYHRILTSWDGVTLNSSGTNMSLGGFTGTLTYASEVHNFRLTFVQGGVASTGSNLDNYNITASLVNVFSPTVTNGRPTSTGQIHGTWVNNRGASGASNNAWYFCDVLPSILTGSTYKDGFWMPTLTMMAQQTVTGTAGVTTYAYYPWLWNASAANTYVGRAKDAQSGSPTSFEMIKYKV